MIPAGATTGPGGGGGVDPAFAAVSKLRPSCETHFMPVDGLSFTVLTGMRGSTFGAVHDSTLFQRFQDSIPFTHDSHM
jgi:hypothetical protein